MDPFCLMYDLTSSFFFSSMSGRGTSIADKSTQLYLVEFNQDYLFNGGDEAWEDLIENVQPGWEDDSFDDDDDSLVDDDGDVKWEKLFKEDIIQGIYRAQKTYVFMKKKVVDKNDQIFKL